LMVGNSSSGLVEAGAYQLPVIDIGSRQRGRLRGPNVIHADLGHSSLLNAFRTALSPEFKLSLQGTTSPYGDGKSGQRILEILRHLSLPLSISKVFYPATSVSLVNETK